MKQKLNIWYQNTEIFFCHQMGPEQTLRRETWTDRRQISVRVSFIFNKNTKCDLLGATPPNKKKLPCEERSTTDPGGKRKKNVPARNAPQQTPYLEEKPYPIILFNNLFQYKLSGPFLGLLDFGACLLSSPTGPKALTGMLIPKSAG